MTNPPPEIIEVNSQQIEDLLDRAASNTLREEDTELRRQIFDSYTQFFQIVGDKNTTIARLRKMLFGPSSEKSAEVVGETEDVQEPDASASDDSCGEHDDASDSTATGEAPSQRPGGHGRHSADDYSGIRHQFHHVIDIVPTILEAVQLEPPEVVDGIPQKSIEGVSMAHTFDRKNADAASTHKTQYFEMVGDHAIYHDG